MEYKISNDLGLITISEDVLLKVAGYAALECYGIVAMSSKRAKDGFVEWLGKENLTKGVQVNITDAGIELLVRETERLNQQLDNGRDILKCTSAGDE